MAFKRRRQPSTVFERGGWDGIKNLALIDFSSIQTDAVYRGRPKLWYLNCMLCKSTPPRLPKNCIWGLQTRAQKLQIFHTGHHHDTDSRLLLQKWSDLCRISGQKTALNSYPCQKHIRFCRFLELLGQFPPTFTYVLSFVQIGSGFGELSPKNPSTACQIDCIIGSFKPIIII